MNGGLPPTPTPPPRSHAIERCEGQRQKTDYCSQSAKGYLEIKKSLPCQNLRNNPGKDTKAFHHFISSAARWSVNNLREWELLSLHSHLSIHHLQAGITLMDDPASLPPLTHTALKYFFSLYLVLPTSASFVHHFQTPPYPSDIFYCFFLFSPPTSSPF